MAQKRRRGGVPNTPAEVKYGTRNQRTSSTTGTSKMYKTALEKKKKRSNLNDRLEQFQAPDVLRADGTRLPVSVVLQERTVLRKLHHGLEYISRCRPRPQTEDPLPSVAFE